MPSLPAGLLLLLSHLLKSDVAAYPGPYPPGGSCNTLGQPVLCIGAPTSSNAVLQREPASAAITGSVPKGWGTPPMTVTVVLTDEDVRFTPPFRLILGLIFGPGRLG